LIVVRPALLKVRPALINFDCPAKIFNPQWQHHMHVHVIDVQINECAARPSSAVQINTKETNAMMKADYGVTSAGVQTGVGLVPQFMRMAAVKNLANTLLAEIKGIGEPIELNLANGINIKDEIRRYETELIRLALRLNGNHQLRTARMLGIKPTTLNAKIKRFAIQS
jgi:DNA-binding NtrC family response regulator